MARSKAASSKHVVEIDSDSDFLEVSDSEDTESGHETSASAVDKTSSKSPLLSKSDVRSRTGTPTKSRTSNLVVASAFGQPVKKTDAPENDSFDVLLPPMNGTTGECNVLIQVHPEDAQLLDYEGVSGAIGRFEAGEQGIVLDLKGCQYRGSLLPGPTAMVVGFAKGGQLRVEGMTDEFSMLVKTQDVMAQMDAIVTGAALDDGYKVVEENVNKASKTPKEGDNDDSKRKGTKTAAKIRDKKLVPGNRGASKTPSKPTAKRRKLTGKTTTSE